MEFIDTKITEREIRNIQKHHPAVVIESCKKCGGYQTVTKEFDGRKFNSKCQQCGEIEEWKLWE